MYVIVLTTVSWVALSWVYVISNLPYLPYLASTDKRVMASIVLTAATTTPLLVDETLRKIGLARAQP